MVKSVAVAVVVRDGKVLVQHRYRPNIGMVYEFPCGSVDDSENMEDAAIRELREETGLRNCSHISTFYYSNRAGIQLGFVILHGRFDEEPQMVNPVRKQTFYWFKLNEIPIDKFLPTDREFIGNDLKDYV